MPDYEMSASWDQRADVVIVGAGFAGLAAAIEARLAGASVVVLDKMKTPGGNSSLSDGCLAAAGTPWQEQAGVQDSPELMAGDMLKAGLGLNHPELVRVVAEKSAAMVRWTREYLGVKYLDRLDRLGGHSVPRSLTTHNTSGAAIIHRQRARLRELGVGVKTRSFLTGILSGRDGAVQGVEYREGYLLGRSLGQEPKRVKAARAVILATGGFGSDIGFRTAQNPRLDKSVGSTNHPGATAEGLIKALRLGAAPVHLSWIQLGPWACADEKSYGPGSSFVSYSVFPAGLAVDPQTGRRFVNELADRRVRAEAILETGRVCVGIVDATGAQRTSARLGVCLKKGYVRTFDDLESLAGYYGIPIRQLGETLKRFNRGVEEKRDQDWGKPILEGVEPIGTPPFYAVRIWPKVHFTMGGVRIDPTARVLDLEGRPISRFYAAGEVTGGVHGASRLGSCAITECLVLGRIAGQNAAAERPGV